MWPWLSALSLTYTPLPGQSTVALIVFLHYGPDVDMPVPLSQLVALGKSKIYHWYNYINNMRSELAPKEPVPSLFLSFCLTSEPTVSCSHYIYNYLQHNTWDVFFNQRILLDPSAFNTCTSINNGYNQRKKVCCNTTLLWLSFWTLTNIPSTLSNRTLFSVIERIGFRHMSAKDVGWQRAATSKDVQHQSCWHKNGNCSVFVSKCPWLPPKVDSPRERMLKERITPRCISHYHRDSF